MRSEQLRLMVLAPNPWHGPWMNRQQLFSRLGRRHAILYSNGLWTVWDRHLPEWKSAPLLGRYEWNDLVCIDFAPKLLMSWPFLSRLDSVVNFLGIKRWRRQLDKMDPGPLVGYVFHPQYIDVIGALTPDYLVYHAYDLYHRTPGWSAQLQRQEERLVKSADLVLASSEVVGAHLAEIRGEPVKVLPNGVDFDAFASALQNDKVPPADLQEIPKPRIGYTGNLNRKVDFSLIAILARRRPDWSFVFIGGMGSMDQYAGAGIEECRKLPNIYFLGAKNHDQLPAYVSHMDVNIMCYRISDEVWTAGIYPLKLHEYLATGLPVVSSDIPSVRSFTSYLTIAKNADEWECSIEVAINGDTSSTADDRRMVARKNSWNQRAEKLNEYLDGMVAGEND